MESQISHPIDFEFLARLFLEMAQERSLEQLLQKLSRRALEAPGAGIAAVVIWLVENESSPSSAAATSQSSSPPTLYAVAGGTSVSGDGPAQSMRLPDQLARVPVGCGPIGAVASTKQTCILTSLDEEPGELAGAHDWLRAERICAFTGAPILFRDEVLGVLGSFSRFDPPRELLQWGRALADHLAAAIINARSFEEIRRLNDRLKQQNEYLREEVVEAKAFGDLVGQSAPLSQVVRQIDLVAPTDASVLILGETGTGKELVAHEIHCRSRRHDKPMVRVNCASVPRDLYESEFFGHARGAFTGAVKDRAGRFETAEGGTLFLDEIAEVPLELQSKLLRVLQEKCYERVGEDRTRRANVRIIAATNRDLKEEVEAGRFREDLYYRLSVFPIQVAPLRERQEDIPLLAQHFAHRSVRQLGCPTARLTRAGVIQLQSYDWPGNVRELQNVIERAVILAKGGVLEFDLPVRHAPPSPPPDRGASDRESGFLTEAEMRQHERENLLAVLTAADWRIRGPGGAAELLGVKATTLQSRLRAMGIERPARAKEKG